MAGGRRREKSVIINEAGSSPSRPSFVLLSLSLSLSLSPLWHLVLARPGRSRQEAHVPGGASLL